MNLFNKLVKFPTKLGDITTLFVGLQTSADPIFLFKDWRYKTESIIEVFSKSLGKYISIEENILKPVVRSGEIGRYWANPSAKVLFPYELVNGKYLLIQETRLMDNYPKAWQYLLVNKKRLIEREHGKFRDTGWYQLYPKNLDKWEKNKVMLPYMVTRLSAYYDKNSLYFVNVTTGGFGLTTNLEYLSNVYLAALLNSKISDWFLKKVSTNFHGGYFAANKQFLVQLPIYIIDFDNLEEKSMYEKIVFLAEEIQSLKIKVSRTPNEKVIIKREIEIADKKIDALIYKLYGLSNRDIEIVESSYI